MRNGVFTALIGAVTALASIAEAQVQLGNVTLGTSRAPVIRGDVSFNLRGGLGAAVRTSRFALRTGGVAFGAVARPGDGVAAEQVRLDYDASAPDGERVVVWLDDERLLLPAADWLVVPTARFASQDHVEAVTAFGRLTSGAETRAFCGRIINYAEAFANTTLGLRIMQADLLSMVPDWFGDLPRRNGEYVLAAGEDEPSSEEVAARAASLRELMASAGEFSSYVLSDHAADMTFAADGGRLVVSGSPTYHLQRFSTWSPRRDQALQEAMAKLESEPEARFVAWLVARARRAAGDLRREPPLVVQDSQRLLAVVKDRRADPVRRIAAYLDIVALKDSVEAEVEYVPAGENPFDDPDVLHALNPAVYGAVEATARYAAFFRYVRLHHPAAWQRFLRSLGAARVPSVTTPTTLPMPEETCR